jgi:glycosyltransferase involved in cell wall biosynthesis
MKPVLFVTGHAPFDRLGAFARLHELEGVEFALFGGRSRHGADGALAQAAGDATGGPPERTLPFPHRHVRQRELFALAASGRHRAVVVSTGGRIALPAAWAGARRAGVPLILWSALWAHPRSAAHALSYPVLRRLYRSADAVVTYGPHVSAYVRARGARNVHVAPQAVDNEFWSRSLAGPPAPDASPADAPAWLSETDVRFLFAGRPLREKGVGVLIEAWSDSGLLAPSAALVLVGVGSIPPWIPAGGAVRRATAGSALRHRAVRRRKRTSGGRRARRHAPHDRSGISANVLYLDPVPPVELRHMYATADVLVVPSIPTRTFREPWGLVVNEAMNRELPVIASDAVGAVAGGLVSDGRNGLVVPAGDVRALAGAMRRLAGDPALRVRLGEAGRRDVQDYTYDAWAQGFSAALASLGLSRAGELGRSSGRRW